MAEVENRTLHATRHTFISVARATAKGDVVERITHNASGETIDDYTSFEWATLCDAVSALDFTVDRETKQAFFVAP